VPAATYWTAETLRLTLALLERADPMEIAERSATFWPGPVVELFVAGTRAAEATAQHDAPAARAALRTLAAEHRRLVKQQPDSP
jgi:hypothetical protein